MFSVSEDSVKECGAEAKKELAMSFVQHRTLSRRGFCLCCVAAAGYTTTGGWLSPSQAYAEARNIVDLIRDDAARGPIKLHKVRHDVSILEGSGGNIAVLTGADGKVFIDAGITASRPRILEAANSLSRDPIRYLINTHWHFDHADGNTWLNAEGAAIIAHENTHKHLLGESRIGTTPSPLPPSRQSRPKCSPQI
jgi:glyoxylase-like metal-dependent hydrolase (beta-lactamase superfamily II)